MDEANILANEWKELREKVRQNWKAFTADDLEQIDGHFDVLVDMMQEKYGYSKLLAEDEVKRFVRDHSAERVQ